MKALIADDSNLARVVLINAAKQAGFDQFDQAQDGLEAIERIKHNHYDVVFMDWNMPNMQGIDAVRAIRAMGKTMPIIMVTGLADQMHVNEAIAAGVNNYLIKPFKPETAITKIEETITACCS